MGLGGVSGVMSSRVSADYSNIKWICTGKKGELVEKEGFQRELSRQKKSHVKKSNA